MQEQLDTQSSTAEHVSQAVRGLEQRNTAMQRQMAVKVASHLQCIKLHRLGLYSTEAPVLLPVSVGSQKCT